MSINFTAFNILMLASAAHELISHRQNEFTLFSARQSEGSVSDVNFIFFSAGRNLSYNPGSRFPIIPSCILESNRGGAALLRDGPARLQRRTDTTM